MPTPPTHFSRNPLRRPFPDRVFGPSVMWGHARTGLFVFAVLYFAQPFGIDFGANNFLVSLGYGLVTFLLGITYSYVTERYFGVRRFGPEWTLGRWVLDCGWLLLLISVGNYFYHNILTGYANFSLWILAAVALPVTLVGLLPILFSGSFIQMQAERDNQRTATLLARLGGRFPTSAAPAASPLISLTEDIQVNPAALLFCEAAGAGVRVVKSNEDGTVEDRTLRTDLATVEAALAETALIRCHPRYLVNTQRVTSARADAQGLRLNLAGITEEVPVSNAYVPVIRRWVLG